MKFINIIMCIFGTYCGTVPVLTMDFCLHPVRALNDSSYCGTPVKCLVVPQWEYLQFEVEDAHLDGTKKSFPKQRHQIIPIRAPIPQQD